jgi:ribosomal protein S18 acetylase RimI-like enzyme
MNTNSCLLVAVTDALSTDVERLARWITAAKEAPIISGLESATVLPQDIESWIEASIGGWVVRSGDEPIAFGTLSNKEANVPEGGIEACHVIVRPEWRRRFKGTQLVAELMGQARSQGYTDLFGRVVPLNGPSHGFLQFLDWRPTSAVVGPESGRFVWYRRRLLT